MKPRALNLRDWQVKALQRGELKDVWIPLAHWVHPQAYFAGTHGPFALWRRPGRSDIAMDMIPCPLGCREQVLWVRESFKVEPTPGCTYGESMMRRKLTVFYKDGGRKDLVGHSITGPGFHVDIAAADYDQLWYGRWRSASNMSMWASRSTVEIESIEAREIQSITTEECYRAGILLPVTETDDPTKRKMLVPLLGKGPLDCMPMNYLPKGKGMDHTEEDVMRALFASEWDQWQRKRFPWAVGMWAWRVTVKVSPGNTFPGSKSGS